MCTVTYIPAKESLYITSNRDEKNWRTDAVPPKVYKFSSGNIMFPKDSHAGGTWIAVHENGNIVVFLNGGLQAHTPTPPYRTSRGLVLLDLVDHLSPYDRFNAVDLADIEPFTAIIRDKGELVECRWDGDKKHNNHLDADQPHIWSSVTLYDEDMIAKRKTWFDEWNSTNDNPLLADILNFHQFTGEGDSTNDLRMNRSGMVFTVSITAIEINYAGILMEYLDLKNDKRSSSRILFDSSIAGR
jgi:hypothetical protein